MFLLGFGKAGKYVGINRTGAISLKYLDAISENHNKTDYKEIKISQCNCINRNIFRVENKKIPNMS